MIVIFYSIIYCLVLKMMNKNLKTQIIELRKKGLTYDQIKKKLNCSKSTISFHCNDKSKEKTYIRQRKRRKNKPLEKKIESFLRTKNINNIDKTTIYESYSDRLKIKTWNFTRAQKRSYGERMFNETELINKIGTTPKCYLTGRPINLNQSKSYALDHVVPRSKGGNNSIDNCEIACIEANKAKHNMSYDEFVQLCKEVVEYHNIKLKRSR